MIQHSHARVFSIQEEFLRAFSCKCRRSLSILFEGARAGAGRAAARPAIVRSLLGYNSERDVRTSVIGIMKKRSFRKMISCSGQQWVKCTTASGPSCQHHSSTEVPKIRYLIQPRTKDSTKRKKFYSAINRLEHAQTEVFLLRRKKLRLLSKE
jgi:hypothetical protein